MRATTGSVNLEPAHLAWAARFDRVCIGIGKALVQQRLPHHYRLGPASGGAPTGELLIPPASIQAFHQRFLRFRETTIRGDVLGVNLAQIAPASSPRRSTFAFEKNAV